MPDAAECKIDEILAKEVLNRGICIRARAVGPSMYPFIAAGDKVLVEPRAVADLNIGDIVLYQDGGRYVIHRLLKKNGADTIITRGDNSSCNDLPVPVENVMGRIIQIEGRGRRMQLTGKLSYIFARVITWFAPIHIRGKRKVVRNLGRLWWLVEGKRIT